MSLALDTDNRTDDTACLITYRIKPFKNGAHRLVWELDSETLANYLTKIPLSIPDFSALIDPTPLDYALAYAEAGWFLVPVRNGTKNPGGIVGAKWQVHASRNAAQIRRWWAEHPDAGIALVPGRSGAVVFDMDKTRDGMTDPTWIALQSGQVQRTRDGDSVRGHYVFACGINAYGNAAGAFMRYGEVRCRNGCIIVEPTQHAKADDGGLYRWEASGCVPALPAVLADLLTKSLPNDEHADPKSLDELAAFLAAHTGDDREYALDGPLTYFAGQIADGASRHESLCKALVWAFREAIAGCYPAVAAEAGLRAAFEAVKPESAGTGEFDRVACWAAAQAECADVADTLARLDRDVWPAPETPLLVARRVAEHAVTVGQPLKRWRGGWHRWDGCGWPEISEEQLRGDLYEMLGAAKCFRLVPTPGAGPQGGTAKVPTLVDWNPDKAKLDKVIDALKSVVVLTDSVNPLSWLDGRDESVIACANTLVRVSDRSQIDCTPEYFNTFALPFDFDPNAGEPKRWLDFLASVWCSDAEAVGLLQEWFGYVLSGRTDVQKMLLMIGPTRSGKGTIDKVLAALVGKPNYVGTSAKYLQGDFGLEPLLGKSLAVFSDDRVTVNGKALVETILKITGEDDVTVNRKYRSSWVGPLPTRLMLISNEIPTLPDNSRAIVGRMLCLRMTKSFLGKEDTKLLGDLLAELPSILLWSLDGLDRLRARGEFVQPDSGELLSDVLADGASPITAFADEMCLVSGGDSPDERLFASVADMYRSYSDWCDRNGHNPGSGASMGKALMSAFGAKVRIHRPRFNGKQVRGYLGIQLIPTNSRIVANQRGSVSQA